MQRLIPTGEAPRPVAFAEVPQPVPEPDEALIKVEAFAPNRGETFLLEHPRPELLPGKDIAGLVVQAAADGSGPGIGTRVVGHPAQGGWAEYAAVPTHSLVVLPDSIDGVRAAALPLAGITALRLLRTAGSLAGRRVLLTGASGGVGHYVTELAVGAGAELTAVTATPVRGERLAELGAKVVHEVAAAQGPFDVVLESTGGPDLALALSKVRPGGLLVWFGQASRTPVSLDFFQLLDGPERVTIQHFHYAGAPYGSDLAALVSLVEQGRLHPEISRIADWAQTAETLVDLRERRIRGKAVLLTGGAR
ncbi:MULTISPECIES: zinc-binding dehydrogenase [unclassified Streptomyces]|uniref:zinc-binding dehydrogenase n=1 Tax=unclassified Streptomyces TaxID=2593676 RepID=UPI00224E59B6|nr:MULTISPECIES: zinc-binding dehydrogenase [unclassified Streptomyces]WTB61061.1 zinc-binding dehydrogenase [Streptomyces sp. NBC_00826]WTH96202.1 zinc-binding dehydrogenase [Streptomyces sp. NBC_00825]WTI04775.1 zinc-binding dehydrogenase [Streptomyces sp. NBC_00822]MCX4870594.1 zinc-binding dehydrogenase [Streptomyces sp. NBC_00906]MCX4901929.1 zinc-binding dehydrogenase [Streptomyces sp. NBC_00892]